MTDNEHSPKIMNKSQYSNLNIRIPKELHQKLKDTCHQRRDSITDVLTKAINDYLSQDNECNEDNEDRTATLDIGEIEQLQQQINQLQERLDNSQMTQRLERLENKQSENYQAIARLQDTYPEYVNQTKQLKEDVRTLKHETQQLKINKPSQTDIHNLEVVLAQKIDQQQLDERLSMATMPIWEHLDSAPEETGWMQKQLMARLNCSKASINAWIKKGILAKKTAERDPEGIGWEKRGDLYYPIA